MIEYVGSENVVIVCECAPSLDTILACASEPCISLSYVDLSGRMCIAQAATRDYRDWVNAVVDVLQVRDVGVDPGSKVWVPNTGHTIRDDLDIYERKG